MDTTSWIIFSDDDLLVINKPAGILSIPDGYRPDIPHLKSILEPEFGGLWVIHRLDKDTSGILLLARNPKAHRFMNQQFDNHHITKEYTAITLGNPPWQQISADYPLTVNGDRAHRTRVLPGKGKPALTDFLITQSLRGASLLTAYLHTGYTHQIRAHLSYLGYPILFDDLYTQPQLRASVDIINTQFTGFPHPLRTMLHANRIRFTHPASKLPVEFNAALPGDFLTALNWLNK